MKTLHENLRWLPKINFLNIQPAELLKNIQEKISVRRIMASEAEKFLELRLKALTTDPDIFVTTMEEERKNSIPATQKRLENNHTLGAFMGNQLLGILMLIEQPQQKFKHIGMLGSMYVIPEYRTLGLGKKLLTQMLQDIKKFSQFETIQLKVITTNTVAIKLYESFGFFKWATEEKALKFRGKYFDQHHYMLRLK